MTTTAHTICHQTGDHCSTCDRAHSESCCLAETIMAKMGRPALPKHQRRTEHLKTVVTEAEAKQARSAAKSAGLTLSDWIYSLVRANLK